MSQEQLEAFLEKIKTDTSLRRRSKPQLIPKRFLRLRKRLDLVFLLMTSLRLNQRLKTHSWKMRLVGGKTLGVEVDANIF